MKYSFLARAGVIGLAALVLSSCQYGYDITAFVRDGHIIFKLGDCGRVPGVNFFQVEEVAHRRHGVWRLETTKTNGPELRELQYGKVPNGFKETVRAEQLEVGRVYRVGLFAIDGVGRGLFAISDKGEVLKVSED